MLCFIYWFQRGNDEREVLIDCLLSTHNWGLREANCDLLSHRLTLHHWARPSGPCYAFVWLAAHSKFVYTGITISISDTLHCYTITLILPIKTYSYRYKIHTLDASNGKHSRHPCGVRKGLLTSKVPLEKIGAFLVSQIHPKKDRVFYVKGRERGQVVSVKTQALRIPLMINMLKQELLAWQCKLE